MPSPVATTSITPAAAASARRTRTVRVHGAEISTDQEMLGPYAETIAMLVALVAIGAAAWAVAIPSATADLPVTTESATAAPVVYAANRTTGSTADVVWADPFDAPLATAVTVIAPTEAPAPDATAGQPLR